LDFVITLKLKIESIKDLIGLGRGHERTKRTKRNIAALFLIKGLSILVGLALVPMTINYLSPTRYGIWITLTSLVAWFSFFDIGLGNGLRNRFAEAIANGNTSLAKAYVSTTYIMLIIIMGLLFVLFLIINNIVDWGVILNAGTDSILKQELSRLAVVVFGSFAMTLVLNLISVILIADQRLAKSAMLDLIGKSLSLLAIFILTQIKAGSLLIYGLVYCSVAPLVLVVSTFWFFNRDYRLFRPSINAVDLLRAKDLISLGFRFFVIQLTAILLYQTNNMIISQLFGPALVTTYNVAFRYFSVLLMGFMIVIAPFWSAFTEAWEKRDIPWISGIMKKLRRIWFLIIACGVIMLIFSNFVYHIWIGKDFMVPMSISGLSLCWVLINSWNGIFSNFLNGVGKIKLQLYFGTIAAVLNIPLAIFLGKRMGISGVLLSNLLVMSSVAWIGPRQYRRIISGNASGIWNG
jgi:O-antigen/teichoic acid export membrane protein